MLLVRVPSRRCLLELRRDPYEVVGSPHRIWRGQDDRNLVIVCETYDSRETAEKAFGDATARAMARAGVDASSSRIETSQRLLKACNRMSWSSSRAGHPATLKRRHASEMPLSWRSP